MSKPAPSYAKPFVQKRTIATASAPAIVKPNPQISKNILASYSANKKENQDAVIIIEEQTSKRSKNGEESVNKYMRGKYLGKVKTA